MSLGEILLFITFTYPFFNHYFTRLSHPLVIVNKGYTLIKTVFLVSNGFVNPKLCCVGGMVEE